jgi:hypothetical protein
MRAMEKRAMERRARRKKEISFFSTVLSLKEFLQQVSSMSSSLLNIPLSPPPHPPLLSLQQSGGCTVVNKDNH